MPRGISGNFSDNIAGRITAPGYFVEIIFKHTTWLGSSRGDLVLPGVGEGGPTTAPAMGIQISGLGVDGAASSQTGSMTILDPDGDLAALIMSEGAGDKRILIFAFAGEVVESGDDWVLAFDGVGDDAAIDPEARTVTISLQQQSGQTLYAPRRYITRENGFSVLPPDGTIIVVGNETYTLQSEVT